MITALSFILASGIVKAQEETGSGENGTTLPYSVSNGGYAAYLANFADYNNASEIINIKTDTLETGNSGAVLSSDKVIWQSGKGELRFTFESETSAFFNIEIIWKPIGSGIDPVIGIMIDGEYPYKELESVTMSRMWVNSEEGSVIDGRGDEYAPEQTEYDGKIETLLSDISGLTAEPYKISVKEGSHTFALNGPGQGIEIYGISLKTPANPPKYADTHSDSDISAFEADIITIQGEDADIKSSKTLIPKADNSDAGMTPNDIKYQKINYIGGTSWQSPGEALLWNFNVETEGYYYLNIRYKQSDLVNGVSLRRLKLDSSIPFEEAMEIGFPYGTGWEYYVFGDGESPYYIWLDKGNHTLSLEVTVGEQSEYASRLSELTGVLGDKYIEMIMITGSEPDTNLDYELFSQIPDLTSTFENCSSELDDLAEDMTKFNGGKSTQSIAAIKNMSRVIKNMLKSPYIAQQYINDYYSNYTSLCSWAYDLTQMPLCIDEMQFVPSGKECENKNANIAESFIFGLKKLMVSFASDYGSESSTEEKGSLRLWVNWGLDQAASLNSIIKNSFTKKTGIAVNLEVVNASLINGILSGNFPDVAINMARTEPVNLGIRGALVDLRQFGDCEEVLNNFNEGAEVPYEYNGALYALPDTQTFFLMFYRTDILDSLGIKVPDTWEEFISAATAIQRKNMDVYVPYTQITGVATVNTGIGSLHLLPTMLVQNGLDIYNPEKNATNLTSREAITVFESWTDLYTKYLFNKEADFYNRFRAGSMPLGIATVSTYMTLYDAAPEIKGRWSVALVPGTPDGEGINRSNSGAGTGCAIIEKSDNKEAAWEFLKWWTSAEAQIRYNNSVESLLGMIGRTLTSNTEAFESLSWNSEDFEIILQQRSYIVEIPEVPGSYYVSRSVDQAFWNVVNGESNPRDALTKWCGVADDEITEKITEYDLG